MRTTTTYAAHLLLLSCAVNALPEVAITKHRHADFNPALLSKRQNGDSGGTVETNTYDVLTWSTGGAYYANGEYMWCLDDHFIEEHTLWREQKAAWLLTSAPT
jgi:hypothetical protein